MRVVVRGEIKVWVSIYFKGQMGCGLTKEDEHSRAGWPDLSIDP